MSTTSVLHLLVHKHCIRIQAKSSQISSRKRRKRRNMQFFEVMAEMGCAYIHGSCAHAEVKSAFVCVCICTRDCNPRTCKYAKTKICDARTHPAFDCVWLLVSPGIYQNIQRVLHQCQYAGQCEWRTYRAFRCTHVDSNIFAYILMHGHYSERVYVHIYVCLHT